MTAEPGLTPEQAQRRFLLLTSTRWLPVGFVMGLFGLLALERGLSVGEVLTYGAAQGIVVMLLELPTSGFADAFGRRALLIVAGLVNLVVIVLYLRADSFVGFAAAAALMGVYRALDSGPLEAWFVDAVHAQEPDADLGPLLARAGTVLGAAVALGAVGSAGLVRWHPLPEHSALILPLVVYGLLGVGHLALTAVLVTEPAAQRRGWVRARAAAREAPHIVAQSVRLVRTDRALLWLMIVEATWVTAMIVFENLMPLRLAELLGSEQAAGRWVGLIAAGGWGLLAFGSLIAGRLAPRFGTFQTAILARLLNGLGALIMGLAGGPVALVAAYALTYAMHGANGPMHAALLHARASAGNRATVLSLNSLVAFGAGAVAGPALGAVASASSTPVAMMLGGAIGTLGAWGYVAARRAAGTSRGT